MTIVIIYVDNHAILYYTIYGRETIIKVQSQEMDFKNMENCYCHNLAVQ